MLKKIILAFFINLICSPIFSQEYESSSSSGSENRVDFLLSGGYSQIVIAGNSYQGYNGSAKLLFPLSSSFSFGIGGKYEYATSDSGELSDPNGKINSTFNSNLCWARFSL